MKRLRKPTACALCALLLRALLLCALLICTLLSGCKKEPSSGIPNGEEPPASIGSEPYTPEEVFLLLTNAEDVRLSQSIVARQSKAARICRLSENREEGETIGGTEVFVAVA